MAKKLLHPLILITLFSTLIFSCSGLGTPLSTSVPAEQTGTPSPVVTPVTTQIKMDCDDRESTPLQLTEDEFVQTYIRWAAHTAEQVNDYIAAENTAIYLDGEPISSITTHGSVELMEESRLYVVQSNFDVGKLSRGNHIIRTVIDFDQKVFDGFDWYGPGTDCPVIDTTCTVVVEGFMAEAEEAPSLIFHNGTVITIEKAQPLAQAVAIRGGLIQAVGSDEDILALQGPDTVVIDLQGKTLMPGFMDGHTHYMQSKWIDGVPFSEMTADLVRSGLTSETEMHGNQDFIQALLTAEQNGDLVVRVNVFAQYNLSILVDGRTEIDPAWYLDNPPILDPSRLLRIPGVKIFVDGDGSPARGCPYYSFTFPPTV